jgi:3-dehydroquinate synthase
MPPPPSFLPDPTYLTLGHPEGTTPVVVGESALESSSEALAAWLAGLSAFVISTPRVLALHGDRLSPISSSAIRWTVLTVEDGEGAKTTETAARLWSEMLEAGGKRDSRVLAFGGGSVGDLAGFVAGCFLRGVEFVQIPTTLLAQVDAAIGGKTGVDLPEGKNTVGLFHHPARVICDTSFLETLPVAELRSGLVEVIKMAALLDPPLFHLVEGRLEKLLEGDPVALAPVVAAAAAAKIGVVERDPTEQGDRRLLNFGHTLGHALETAAGYSGLRHGEAVAYGLLFALRLGARVLAPSAELSELADCLRSLLARLDLPPLPAVRPGYLLPLMARDKKAREVGITWVLAKGWGEGWMAEGIPWSEVEAELAAFLPDPFARLG